MRNKTGSKRNHILRRWLIPVLASVLLLGLASGDSLAQTQFGTVTGRVLDSTGAIIPGAKVTLTHATTSAKQKTATNDEGLFVLANVAAGNYDLSVEKQEFKKTVQRIKVDVAQRLELDLILQVGQVTETVTVTESRLAVNTISAELSKQISSQDIETLPLLTRNPYALAALAPGTADTATATGDTRGIGIGVAGGRSSSLNFLLDGAENNETFATGPSTIVPIDAIQEFRVQTNNMTAEFGRNTLVTNVVTKSGSNEFHGSVYHFYRGAALSTETFEDKASGTPKANFVRNNFGASTGGKIIRDKLFYFGSFEGLRVASSGNQNFFVPTQQFFDNASANMQSYLTAGGGIPSHGTLCMTAADVAGGGTLFRGGTSIPIASNTPLFCRATVVVPVDAGGGTGQNTWSGIGKLDYRFSDRTSLSGRFAYFNLKFPVGAGSVSPFSAFNTGFTFESHNSTVSLTHSFTPTIFSESRIAFSRTTPNSPLGEAPFTVPCVQYGGRFNTPTGDQIVFPGYLPNLCGGFSIPSGGPQNTYTAFSGWTWLKGKHTFKWGGYLSHLRDNHTFGALANASINVAQAQNLLDGETETSINVAIDPNGKFPGQLYNQTVDGAFRPPSFNRHFRYNEVAFYGEDQWKLHPRFTLTLGLRWEYFGVLHSPSHERFLDANLYLDAVGAFSADKSIFEQIRDARFSRTNNLFQQDWNNFGPRVGIAWDISGNQRTVLRGGYGLYYDKNFGNALFNVIQNFPNYAVLTVQSAAGLFPNGLATARILPNQFDTLSDAAGPGNFTLGGSARMLNREMVTAYTAQWNATLEHDVLGKGIIASLSYIGANGYQLYSLNNLNQRGACLLLVQVVPGSPCTPAGGNSSRINQSGLTGMNRRGNEGFSRYNAMNLEVKTRRIGSTGLTASGAYTWAHSIDNASSFFNDSIFDGNGNFGFKDPFQPALDKANSSNDIRHRLAVSWNWEIPFAKGFNGVARQALHGWGISGIWQAQTGGAFTVYDMFNFTSQCSISFTNACYPLQTGSTPTMDGRTPVPGAPNSFVLYDISNAYTTQADFCATNTVSSPLGPLGGLACTAALYTLHADMLAPRNSLRLPGFWNVDFGVLKDFPLKVLREGTKLQFRAEVFNLFNHSNLYGDPNTNLVFDGGGTQQVLAKRGNRPGQVFGVARDRRNIQLALRFVW